MLSPDRVKKLVQLHMPDIDAASCCILKRGLVNENYIFSSEGREYILRVYPKDGWKAEKESYLYGLMQEASVPSPKVYFVDDKKKQSRFSYIILDKIEGEQMDQHVSGIYGRRLARQAGIALARMHKITFPCFGWIVRDRIEPRFSNWRDFIFFDLGEKMKKLKRIKGCPMEMIGRAMDFIAQNSGLLEIREKPCLVHKDYHPSHIIVSKGKLKGIIDIEWAVAGHSELDFIKAYLWMFEKWPHIEKPFFQGYKSVRKMDMHLFEKRMPLYIVYTLIGLIAFSHDMKSKRWFDLNIRKLKRYLGGCG